jgi:hypothetical protein
MLTASVSCSVVYIACMQEPVRSRGVLKVCERALKRANLFRGGDGISCTTRLDRPGQWQEHVFFWHPVLMLCGLSAMQPAHSKVCVSILNHSSINYNRCMSSASRLRLHQLFVQLVGGCQYFVGSSCHTQWGNCDQLRNFCWAIFQWFAMQQAIDGYGIWKVKAWLFAGLGNEHITLLKLLFKLSSVNQLCVELIRVSARWWRRVSCSCIIIMTQWSAPNLRVAKLPSTCFVFLSIPEA